MLNTTIYFIEKTNSTNKYLADLVSNKRKHQNLLQDFTGVYTYEQIAGRGMGNNHWYSEYGENLLVSFYFEPPIAASQQFFFNRFFTLAVRNMLAHYTDAVIKWPNDILVNQQKIAGILIEHTIVGTKVAHSIAGVGININQTTFQKEIPNPTSLKTITGKTYVIKELLNELVQSCQQYYSILKEEKFDILEKEYLLHLYKLNEPASFLYQEQTVTATITGIDPFGRLVLQKDDGTTIVCGYKEIAFL